MKGVFALFICSLLLLGCKKDLDNSTIGETPEAPVAPSDTVTSSTVNFKGVNWADPRDNFVDDWLILSGLSATDNSDLILSKTVIILSAFQAQGANTVRLPVNPATVLQSWWPRYAAVISKASAKGMKVILAYWEGSSSKDGKVDDSTAYWLMWNTVVSKYISNGNIHFEPFNEPHGYSLADVKSLYAAWLGRYPQVPRRRILLDGAGYATDVNGIGTDNRFDSCLLSFHYYTWFNGNYKTTADWEMPVKSLTYPKRTVTTEFGVTMSGNKDFAGAPASDLDVTYLQGITSELHDLGVGCVYWPGLRTGDTYSMFTYTGNTLTVNSATGLARLQYAWGKGTVTPPYAVLTAGAGYRIINRNSGKALDVTGGSTANGTKIVQWDYSGGNNQQWLFISSGNGHFSIVNKNSSKALDVNGASGTAGTGIIQWEYSGGNNQQWQITNIGFGYYKIINRNSTQSLDVNGGATTNGGNIIQWYWNNGSNQQWQISAP